MGKKASRDFFEENFNSLNDPAALTSLGKTPDPVPAPAPASAPVSEPTPVATSLDAWLDAPKQKPKMNTYSYYLEVQVAEALAKQAKDRGCGVSPLLNNLLKNLLGIK